MRRRTSFLTLLVLALTSVYVGCPMPVSKRSVVPVCGSLARLKELMPHGFLGARDTSMVWLASGELYRTDLSGCLFPVKEDLQVLVQQDWSASPELGLLYSDIFVLDGGERTSTAYPKSADHVVEQMGDTTFISFHYSYRKEHEVRLAYHEHRFSVIKHEELK